MHCLILDKDFHRLSLLHPVPPSHSTQGEGSLVCRKLDLDEQAGNVRDDEKLGHGEDGMQEGHMGDRKKILGDCAVKLETNFESFLGSDGCFFKACFQVTCCFDFAMELLTCGAPKTRFS